MKELKAYLNTIDKVIAEGKYKDNWASLSDYQTPDWYRAAKFGIFVHWGIFSVPAFANEWYSRNMYRKDSEEYRHHVETYGKHTEFGYKDFIPLFRAEKFDPEQWAALFSRAGAKYVVPVAEHHDGFQMYESSISHWNACEKGPCRDMLGELMRACRDAGIQAGASSHRAEHWFFMGCGKEFESDIREPLERGDLYWPSMQEGDFYDMYSKPCPTEEFLQDWLVRCCELADRYRPGMIYFDWWIQHNAFKPYLKKFAAYYYNRALEWGREVVINYKHDAFMFGTAVPDVERGQFAHRKPFFWQTDTSMALNSWCYTKENHYRKASELVCDLADIVSKNGCLLLNVGPKADGTIEEEERKILLEIGRWLSVNGEAIYGTKLWRRSEEGPTLVPEGQFTDQIRKNFTSEDIRFTLGGGYLYAIVLKSSERGEYLIRSLGKQDVFGEDHFSGIIRRVKVLGTDEEPCWERRGEGLFIRTDYRDGDYPIVFQMTID